MDQEAINLMKDIPEKENLSRGICRLWLNHDMHLDFPPDPFEFFSSQNLSHRQLIYVPFMQRCREMIIFVDFIHCVLSLYLKVPVGFSPIRFYFVLWCLWRFSPIRHSFFFLPLMINIIFRFDQKVDCRINKITIWHCSI